MEKITLITLAICATIALMVLIVFLQANFVNGATIEDIKSEITYEKVESLGLDTSADFINLNVNNNQFYAQYQNSFNNYFVFVELKTVDTEPVLQNTQQEKHNNEIPLSVAKNIPKPDYYYKLDDRLDKLEHDNNKNDNSRHNNNDSDSSDNNDDKDNNDNDNVGDNIKEDSEKENEDINAKDDKQAFDSDDSEEMSETVEDSEIPEPNDIEENSD